jgi:hypothetical protein
MSLQYITDEKGKTTGVFIPIQEWENIKSKFEELEAEPSVPEWHKEIVRKRMEIYDTDPSHAIEFEQAITAVEKDL